MNEENCLLVAILIYDASAPLRKTSAFIFRKTGDVSVPVEEKADIPEYEEDENSQNNQKKQHSDILHHNQRKKRVEHDVHSHLWSQPGLNRRPLPCEGSALPLSYATCKREEFFPHVLLYQCLHHCRDYRNQDTCGNR